MHARNKYLVTTDDGPEYEEDIDAQVARLRAILKMMMPETGSAALGALRHAAPGMSLKDRVRAIGYTRS